MTESRIKVIYVMLGVTRTRMFDDHESAEVFQQALREDDRVDNFSVDPILPYAGR